MMQSALNDFFLNEVVHSILFLVMLVLYVNSRWESRVNSKTGDRDFSLFILAFTIYIGLMLPWLWLREEGIGGWQLWSMGFLRVLSATAAYSFVGGWLVALVRAKTQVPNLVQQWMRYGPYVLFAIFWLVLLGFGSLTIANIPMLLNYLFLEALLIKYYKDLDSLYIGIITMFIVPTLILQAQEWWNYTPANIYVVLVVMLIYTHMWMAEKEKYQAERERYLKQRVELENARTRLMLSQIKPHFLYNTLASIARLCTKQPEQARILTTDFSEYLRGNLHSLDSNELIPFTMEMQHVEAYLKIESVRFSNILQVQYDVAAIDFKLPVLTVEPLVENAVKHGVCKKVEGGTITLSTREQKDSYQVIVEDDGAGFDMSKVNLTDGDHVGLRSVRQRLELLCQGTLSIESTVGQGTKVILTVPKKHASLNKYLPGA